MQKKWWHNAIGYQIYPKSFQDTNGDGIGDIPGIIEHLDDLEELGINMIWLCPVNKSPMADHGYDISDYDEIDPMFGTLDDMKRLIKEADKRGIRVLMDLVVNHTSSEHEWFQKALEDPDSRYGKYYIIREGKDGKEPNNWRSIFGGSAWERIGDTDKYYLHLFTRWQPDLNWENREVREEIYAMINRWLDMGLGGFRIDAISHLKKDFTYENLPADGVDGYVNGFPYFRNVKGIETFLNELKKETFLPHDAFTLAEADDVAPEDLEDFIGEDGYFSSIFDFCHTRYHVNDPKWKDRPVEMINDLRDALFQKQEYVNGRGFLCNFLDNHDTSRSAERFIPREDIGYHSMSALGSVNFFFPGIVFLYQGQATGMLDYRKKSIDEFRDPTTFNMYRGYLQEGMTEEQALEKLNVESREHARTPMQWNAQENAGFTDGTPWFAVNPNYKTVNLEAEKGKEESLYHWYRKMIALRKSDEYSELFIYGSLTPVYEKTDGVIAYEREYQGRCVLVICNLKAAPQELPFGWNVKKILLSNHKDVNIEKEKICLRGYETVIADIEK